LHFIPPSLLASFPQAKRLMKEINPVGAEKAFFALGCCE